jgi:hypothetical protein
MPVWLVGILLIAYLAAPIVELRLWRAGRLSNRAVAVLLPARMPVVFGVSWLTWGVRIDTFVIVGLVMLIMSRLAYGWLLSDLRDRRNQLSSVRS